MDLLTYMNLVACSEGLKERLLMNFEVESGNYGEQDLDYLELYLVVPLTHTLTDRLDNGINQLSW